MASPHVAGAVALVRGLAPELSVMEVKELILDTVDKEPQLEPYVLTGGRLNLFNALSADRIDRTCKARSGWTATATGSTMARNQASRTGPFTST